MVESLILKVEIPMIVKCDNKGNVVFGENLKHINVRLSLVRELEEDKIIWLQWAPIENQVGDLHIKNLDRKTFKKAY